MCFCSLLLLCNVRPPSLWLHCNLCLEGLGSALLHPFSFSRLTWMSFKTQLRHAHLQDAFPDFRHWLNARLPASTFPIPIHSPISKLPHRPPHTWWSRPSAPHCSTAALWEPQTREQTTASTENRLPLPQWPCVTLRYPAMG